MFLKLNMISHSMYFIKGRRSCLHKRPMGWGVQGGSDATAASGGKRELSEWQRSVGNAGASSPRRTPGTATGQCLFASVCGARQPLRLTKQASVLPTTALACPLASSAAGSARARNPWPILCFLSCRSKKGRPPAGTGSASL